MVLGLGRSASVDLSFSIGKALDRIYYKYQESGYRIKYGMTEIK
jgi:hypothetical protein